MRKSEKNDVVCGVKISNPEKILIEKLGIKKIDCVRYYEKVASKILKEIRNRPLSVVRCHGKNLGEKFFKKHAQKNEDVERFLYGKGKKKQEYFYIKTKKQLINQIQLGTIEFHAWNVKIDDLNHPDFMIFDLDPDENVSIEKLRKATKLVKNFLAKLHFGTILKTSGGKGFHIYAKTRNLTALQLVKISKQIAEVLEQEYPEMFVTNLSKAKRKNKIFIDYLRNKVGATCVSAYSLRLRENASISMPISWKKLDEILPNEVNLFNFEKFL